MKTAVLISCLCVGAGLATEEQCYFNGAIEFTAQQADYAVVQLTDRYDVVD